MKSMKIALLVIFAFILSTTVAYAGEGCPEAIQSGKEIFDSPEKLGSTTGTSCAKCHPDGKGLKGVAKKKKYEDKAELVKVINMCIKQATNGKELKPDSMEMKYLSAYVLSIGQEGEQGSGMKDTGIEHKGHEGSEHKESEPKEGGSSY